MIGIGLIAFLLWGMYAGLKAWTDWDIRKDVARREAEQQGRDAFLRARADRWPGLIPGGEPPLKAWLATDRFPRLQNVESWTAVQPFSGEADGLPVTGATALLTYSRSYRTTQVRASQLRSTERKTEFEFEGLVLRADGQSSPPATLETGSGEGVAGAFASWLHEAGPQYGTRHSTGDAAFDAAFGLYAPEGAPSLSPEVRERLARLREHWGPVTVCWRDRERILTIAAGAAWDATPEGLQLLEEAIGALRALTS